MRRRSKLLLTFGVVAVLLLAMRLAAPALLERYVNDKLQALQAYDGSVENIDLSLVRGAYRIDGLTVVKTGADRTTPFFSSERIDFSIEWGNLLRGALVAQAVFERPKINLVQAKSDQDSQLGKEVDWAQRLEELFPFRFNTVRVLDGEVTFRAPGIRAQDALKAHAIDGEVRNLTNAAASGEESFATFLANGRVLGDAPLRVAGTVDPLAAAPTFDVDLQIERVQLPKVNPWLREFIKADAESGDFQIYIELAAAEGRFEGYAKPLMQNVEMYSSEKDEGGALKRMWEGLVDFAAGVLESEEGEQVGARIPFSGSLENPQTSLLATIVSVLRNAFVSAFARSLEGSISLRDVKSNLEEVGEQD
ncbi:MAG TPA: DUF748 domain-containing protein [Steroidobacter sp.]|nr:DUF748 domain-containing protein [Steroidobacter sp.]